MATEGKLQTGARLDQKRTSPKRETGRKHRARGAVVGTTDNSASIDTRVGGEMGGGNTLTPKAEELLQVIK